jgi:hypothetical protein
VKPPRISCAFLLPIAELAIWSVLVLIPALLTYSAFYSIQNHRNAATRSGQFDLAPRDLWLELSLMPVCERQFHAIANLNLPGALIGAPLSTFATSYFRTHTSGFSIHTWHSVTMPFFCLPAWWFVGLGVDGTLARKRLHWALRLVGLIFCLACLALVIGILTSPPADREDLLPFMPGAIFWAISFGLFPLNWILTVSPGPISTGSSTPD